MYLAAPLLILSATSARPIQVGVDSCRKCMIIFASANVVAVADFETVPCTLGAR